MRTGSLALAFGGTLVIATGCRPKEAPPETDPVVSSASLAPTLAPLPEIPLERAVGNREDAGMDVTDWTLDVADEEWPSVALKIERLPENVRARPDVRWIRAKAYLALGRNDEAYKLLEGLERELPLLADLLLADRANAAFRSAHFVQAGELYASMRTVRGLLLASESYENASNAERSDALCQEVLRHAKRSKLDEATARARRIRLKLRAAKLDLVDAKWITVHVPEAPEAKDAMATVHSLEPGATFTYEEERTRAKAWLDAENYDEAIAAIDRAGALSPLNLNDRLRFRADALFRAKRWMEAAKAYDDLARARDDRASDHALRSARAFSRADRDDEAIQRYARVASTYPKSKAAEEAMFLGGRLHALHARWAKASQELNAYRKKYPRGEFRREALRYAALGHLLSKEYKEARRAFEELGADESDPVAQASARNMAALAAFREGDKTHAAAVWADVLRSKPFTWAALVAEARLRETKALSQEHIEPRVPVSTFRADGSVSLPSPVDLLLGIGLHQEAEEALSKRESQIESTLRRGTELLCSAYGRIDRGERLFEISRSITPSLLAEAPSATNAWAWSCAFPTPFRRQVASLERSHKLPEGLLHAVMRQESNYHVHARSPVGALGLMQLMPATAKALATELGVPLPADISTPSFNLRASARYLHTLLDQFENLAPLAVASYNAGPDSIEKWRKRQVGMDLDLFVEHIPFQETRTYTMRVLGNLARYRARAGLEPPSIRLH